MQSWRLREIHNVGSCVDKSDEIAGGDLTSESNESRGKQFICYAEIPGQKVSVVTWDGFSIFWNQNGVREERQLKRVKIGAVHSKDQKRMASFGSADM